MALSLPTRSWVPLGPYPFSRGVSCSHQAGVDLGPPHFQGSPKTQHGQGPAPGSATGNNGPTSGLRDSQLPWLCAWGSVLKGEA